MNLSKLLLSFCLLIVISKSINQYCKPSEEKLRKIYNRGLDYIKSDGLSFPFFLGQAYMLFFISLKVLIYITKKYKSQTDNSIKAKINIENFSLIKCNGFSLEKININTVLLKLDKNKEIKLNSREKDYKYCFSFSYIESSNSIEILLPKYLSEFPSFFKKDYLNDLYFDSYMYLSLEGGVLKIPFSDILTEETFYNSSAISISLIENFIDMLIAGYT